MTCERELRLIEKLADGEAKPSERIEAEAHLEICEDCRAHYQFVRALETASKEIALPEPPEAYWQHFPSKVTARIGREENRNRSGFWQSLLSPAVLRFGAVAATLTVVVAVGVSVYRDDPGSLEPDGLPMAERSDAVEREEEGFASPGEGAVADAPEPEGPDGVASPAPAQDADSRVSQPARGREPSSSPAPDRPREVENLSAFEKRAEPGRVAEESVEGETDTETVGRRQNPLRRSRDEKAERSMADEVAPAAEPSAAATPPAAPRTSRRAAGEAGRSALASAPERCEMWRRYLEENGDEGSQSREARYQVAWCALRDYETAPSDETRRTAIRDAEAFLALEDDTDRAEPIRSRLNELRE